MGRYYHLTRRLTAEETLVITRELKERKEFMKAQITEDHENILVEVKEERYPELMSYVVNLCRRRAKGCELQFSRFALQ